MSNPLKALEVFTEADIKSNSEVALGNHAEFLSKLINQERYEEAQAMKRIYDKFGIELPTNG